MSPDWGPALVGCLIAGAGGWLAPLVVARLPEPPNASPEKIPYAELAARPGLAGMLAAASGAAGAVCGLALGWDPALLFLLYLCPLGVTLAYVDWRLRLLPTALIAPSYPVLAVLVALAALLERDDRLLWSALFGWLGVFAFYWLLWRFTPGMGYGDVRLAGLVGMTLGWFGSAALLVGVYAGFLLGVLAWVPMRLFRLTQDRSYPFGPFMLLGVLVAVAWTGVSG